VSEAINVKLEDIDFENKRVKIIGKGNKERIVRFTKETGRILKAYIASCYLKGYIFDITRQGVYTIFKKIGKNLNNDKIIPHNFRHSFACIFLEKGGDTETLRKLLGHSNLNTTSRYCQLLTEQIDDIYKRVMEK